MKNKFWIDPNSDLKFSEKDIKRLTKNVIYKGKKVNND